MGPPEARARTLRGLYRVEGIVSDALIDSMLADRRIEIVTSTRLFKREVFDGRTATLRHGQGPYWERYLKVHVLGHWTLHADGRFDAPRAFTMQQERQANEFAGWLIHANPAETLGWPGYTLTTRSLSALARVPAECVEQWWRIVGGDLAASRPYQLARESAWWRTSAQRMA